jgi:hypothetical protein
VRKLCLLPLIQTKLQILSLLLSNKDVAKLQNVNLATLDRQIISENLEISARWTPSDDLAILEVKSLAIKMTLSDAGDVMLTSSSQNEGIHVIYSTLPTKNLLKTKYTVKVWL